MPLTLILIVIAIAALVVLEIWLFWWLGERDDRQRAARRATEHVSREE